jgi:hypothetical protein
MLATTLKELVTTALGHVPQSAGVPDPSILETERRLGAGLPPPLRDFYGMVGQLSEVTQSHHRFVPIGSLEIIHGGLVFCREQQDQMSWAVLEKDLSLPDPPVVQGQHDVDQWDQHCSAASVFLINFCCWQLVNSMPSIGSTELGPTTLRTLRKHLTVFGASFGFNMLSFISAEAGLLASVLLDIDRLYVGARSDTALQKLQQASSIELDWL